MSKSIVRVVKPIEKDLGGFSVRRLLPFGRQRRVGPWVFFDHMGPADFAPGKAIDVRPHPHINLATVTYLFEGEILHRDSLGCVQAIRPGDINLMVAGKGIVHSERVTDEVRSQGQKLHGLQLWLGLPAKDEETAPAFHHYPSADIPALDIHGVPVRVMIGEAYGAVSPVKTFAKTLYVEARLKKGQNLALPEADERAIYVAGGALQVDEEEVPQFHLAILEKGATTEILAQEDSQIAVIGGEDIGERHLFWNFVSSRKDRLEQAKADWREGRFPKVPGDEKEFIPLPE